LWWRELGKFRDHEVGSTSENLRGGRTFVTEKEENFLDPRNQKGPKVGGEKNRANDEVGLNGEISRIPSLTGKQPGPKPGVWSTSRQHPVVVGNDGGFETNETIGSLRVSARRPPPQRSLVGTARQGGREYWGQRAGRLVERRIG